MLGGNIKHHGLSLTGRIPSGSLGLNYIAEVGYGPSSHMGMDMSGSNPTMTVTDDHHGRAFAVGLIAKSLRWHPVQLGFDV